MKQIIDKLNFITLKKICYKRQHQENEKISHTLGENVCKIYI